MNIQSIRRKVCQKFRSIFSIGLLYIVFTAVELFQYFGPISAYIFRTPSRAILGVQVDLLWVALLLSTTATVANDLISNADMKAQIFCWVVLTCGILSYQLAPSLLNFIFYILATIIISFLFFRAVQGSSEVAVQRSLFLASVGGIFGVSSGLVNSYPITTTIYIGIIGFYLFMRWVLRGRSPYTDTIGIGDRLYDSTVRLVQSSAGVAIQCVIYFGLFTTTSIVSGYVIPLFFSDLLTLSPKKFAINIVGFLFGILFFVLIFAGWLKALERAPYTAKYFEKGNPGDLYEDMPPRQSLLALALPSLGWIWTRLVIRDIQAYTPQVVRLWNRWIVIGYIVFAFVILLYSLACWFKPIRSFIRWFELIRFSKFTTEKHRSVETDIYYYLVGGISLIFVNLFTSPIAAVMTFLACCLLVIDWRFGSDSKVAYLSVFFELLLLYLVIGYLQLNATAAEFWLILHMFLIIYLLSRYRENPNILLDKLTIIKSRIPKIR